MNGFIDGVDSPDVYEELQKEKAAMNNQFTPGPWIVDYEGTVGHIKSVTGNVTRTPTVCRYDILPDNLMAADEKNANARLIAAGPDWHLALHRIADHFDVEDTKEAWKNLALEMAAVAREALTKADVS